MGKLNSIKNEFEQLEKFKIKRIIKEILFYNGTEELFRINKAIKKLYSKNPLYVKYKKPELDASSESAKKEEKTIDDLLNFIINDDNFDKANKKSKKKKKNNKDCNYKNCLNNPNYINEEKENPNSIAKINEKETLIKKNKKICDCDHIDIIVDNFTVSLKENSVHSRFCNKVKPCFTNEWLERIVKLN